MQLAVGPNVFLPSWAQPFRGCRKWAGSGGFLLKFRAQAES